jgi:hypothetical protein
VERYAGDTATAIQCVTIAVVVAAVCLLATLVMCRRAGVIGRAALPALGLASAVSIVLTWFVYATVLTAHVWVLARAWAIVALPLQIVGHVLVVTVLARIGTTGKSTPPESRARAHDDPPPPIDATPPAAPTPAAREVPQPAAEAAPIRPTARATTIAPPPNPTVAPQATAPPARKPRVFISYRRSDSSDVTGRIHDRLAASLGREHVFTDVDSIPLGVDFREHVSDILVRTDCMLAVIGRDWVTAADTAGKRRLDDPADLVRIEIETALARGVPVIPLLVQGAAIPRECDLPESLRGLAFRNGMSVRPNPDFHRDVDRLEGQLLGYARGKPA